MSKNKWLDFLLILLIMLFADCFPITYITQNPYIVYGVRIGLQVLLSIFLIIFSRTRRCSLKSESRRLRLIPILILLPTFVVCGSNFYYAWIANETFQPSFAGYFPLQVILTFFVSFNEDFIFVRLLEGNLTFESRIKRMLLASGIFALSHITRFIGTFNPAELIAMAYTFGLCMIVGFFYEYGGCRIITISFHFFYNFLNSDLYTSLYPYQNRPDLYYFINIGVGLICAIYLIILYFFVFERRRKIR